MKHSIIKSMALFSLMFIWSMPSLSSMTYVVQDTYRFKMALYVPRVYDNMQSKGYRKYQRQTLSGYLKLIYTTDGGSQGELEAKVVELVNNTHKVNGKKITYDCYPNEDEGGYSFVCGLGSNKTMKFNQSGIKFSIIADPSYNIGEVDEDNSLYLTLAGQGSLNTKPKYLCQIPDVLHGSVVGQIGCGCKAYGHISPTRLYYGFVSDIVFDIAPVYGSWNARFVNRCVNSN